MNKVASPRWALVTGGAQGIGLAIVRKLIDNGTQVFVADRDEAGLKRTLGDLSGCVWEVCDLRGLEVPEALVQRAFTMWGGLDLIVHNAGVVLPQTVGEITEEAWQETWEIHVSVAVRLARAFVKRHPSGSSASLIYLASEAAHLGYPAISAYAAAKGALVSLARSQAVELAGRGIRVNTLSPGITDTPLLRGFLEATSPDPEGDLKALGELQPTGRLTSPEELAEAVLFMARATHLTGADMRYDGGATVHGHYLRKHGA